MVIYKCVFVYKQILIYMYMCGCLALSPSLDITAVTNSCASATLLRSGNSLKRTRSSLPGSSTCNERVVLERSSGSLVKCPVCVIPKSLEEALCSADIS